MKEHVARNTGMGKKNFSKGLALEKKKKIETLSKKVRKGKASEADKTELKRLKEE